MVWRPCNMFSSPWLLLTLSTFLSSVLGTAAAATTSSGLIQKSSPVSQALQSEAWRGTNYSPWRATSPASATDGSLVAPSALLSAHEANLPLPSSDDLMLIERNAVEQAQKAKATTAFDAVQAWYERIVEEHGERKIRQKADIEWEYRADEPIGTEASFPPSRQSDVRSMPSFSPPLLQGTRSRRGSAFMQMRERVVMTGPADKAMARERARERYESERDHSKRRMLLGFPKIVWVIVLDVLGLTVFMICIPVVLGCAKRRRPMFRLNQ